MRTDYNNTIGRIDNLSLEQVEARLNTSVSLNSGKEYANLSDGFIQGPSSRAGGITISRYNGFKITGSRMLMAPGLKGTSLHFRNMVFKHEFIHAANLNTPSLIKGYGRYTEKAAHAYSYTYGKFYGGYNFLQYKGLFLENNWRVYTIMDRMKKLLLIFMTGSIGIGCGKFRKNQDNLIFRYETWIEINIKSRTIEIELMKYENKLVLTNSEEDKIFNSFQKNSIGNLKGEIYISNGVPMTPIIDFSFKVYKENEQISDVWINEGYKTVPNSIKEQDRVGSFRDTVKEVLYGNESFKCALRALNDYVEQKKNSEIVNFR